MIKKILGLGIFLLGFIGFSNAGYIGYIGQLQNSSINTSYKVQVNGHGNLLTQYFGAGKRLLQFQDGVYFFWGNSSLPYIYVTSDYANPNNHFVQGFVNDYMICDFIGLDTGNVSSPQNCTRYNINSLSGFLGRYLNGLGNGGYYYYDTYSNNVPARNVYCGAFTICFSNSDFDNSLCFYGSNGNWGFPCDYSLSYPNGLYGNVTNLSNSLGLDPYFDNINSSVLGNSPGQGSNSDNSGSVDLGNGGIELESNESALNYYESRYGRTKNICYVGTDSLSYLYGQNGISFQEGQGLSIFDVYTELYGTGYELKWVGNWLNTWLLNYEQWFNSRGINAEGVGHPSWLSYYNSGTHLGDLYYDNLTFPFANQPVAFYFMATYIDQNAPYSTMGSPVVSYCNIKINSGSFDEIIDQSDKNNITNYTEKSNVNKGLNPDGSNGDYTGYWVSSGVDLAFSGNVSIKNTLKNFFDEFDQAFGALDVNTSNRILPAWFVSAFIFVVLFKFLRKR